MNLHSKTLGYEKMILWLIRLLEIILISRTMNINTYGKYIWELHIMNMNLPET